MTRILVRLSGIERRFGSVVALDGADLELRAGEVHGVLGANGAGKSTLFNVLGGMLSPDAGLIEIEESPVRLDSPRDAWSHGIGLVHQHFTLVPALTVEENLALGVRASLSGGRTVRDAARAVMQRTGLTVPLGARVEELGVGDRQRLEILKALLREPRILVLDEPTAVLTPDEIGGLFGLLRELARQGRAVALVAHKLDEVLGVADRVTVLREGRSVLSAGPGEYDTARLVRAMVGDGVEDPIAIGLDRPLGRGRPRPSLRRALGAAGAVSPGLPVADLRGVSVMEGDRHRLRDVSLEVRRGEVVGIAGVEGNGQRYLARLLAGRLSPSEGAASLPSGVGFIPQDRSREGLIADFDLVENVALALQREPEFRRFGCLRWDRLREQAEQVRVRYEVRAPSVASAGGALSGGNQQRLIVGREIRMASDLLVAENPTRGLDISASAFVHEELRRLASEGVAVALLSTDLDEVLALSTRVYAIARGRISEVAEAERSREGIGALMLAGIHD